MAQPPAPSTAAASRMLWSMACSPAYRTSVMNGAKRHVSARMTVAVAQAGSPSQLGGVIPTDVSRPSISPQRPANIHFMNSAPTTGVTMCGMKLSVAATPPPRVSRNIP